MARKTAESTETLAAAANTPPAEALEEVRSRDDLKKVLGMLSGKMDTEQAAPIYVLTMMNHLLTQSNIYDCLDEDNKELARAIWLRMKQQGMQLKNPPMLFGEE